MTPGDRNAKEQIQREPNHYDLESVEAGWTVREVCREHEISEAAYYQWKSKFGGMEASDIRRLRERCQIGLSNMV